jgi:hypothetical protein
MDVRELDKNPHQYVGTGCFTMSGRVLTIQEAPAGSLLLPEVHTAGGETETLFVRAVLQIQVLRPDASSQFDTLPVVVLTDESTAGVFEDSQIRVWGEALGVYEGTNAFGGAITQPVMRAVLLEVQ